MAQTASTMLALGTTAPEFALTDVVSGKTVTRDDFRGKKALLVMFICAHCPFVKHINEELAKLGKDYAAQPLGIVAISANDVNTHPADGPAGLKEQAVTFCFGFNYLYDETQSVAKAYDAACTPDFYLFDGDFKLVYRGQFDGSRPGNGVPVTGKDLRTALDHGACGELTVLGGTEPVDWVQYQVEGLGLFAIAI